MSFFYAASNNESAKDLFEKRTIYRGTVAGSVEYTNLVNFNFGEKFFYGRTNRLFVPITLNESTLKRRSFKGSQDNSAVNFVVDAFEDMAKQYNKCADTGYIDPNDTYLSRLVVHNAWVNPHTMYTSYLTTYSDSLRDAMIKKARNVKNFDEFIVELELLLKISAYRFPFTKTAFIKSRRCPINCSGLVVEIADLDASNDEEKIAKFIESPNWEFYVNTCRSFGFMIDQFVPWRLVADIASTPMLDYANKYNFDTTDYILGYGYGPVANNYFDKFKYHLLNLYNKVAPTSFNETYRCGDKTLTRKITPQKYSVDYLSKIYPETYFIKLYFKLRFLEEESQFEDFEKEMIVDDCLEIYESHNLGTAIQIFERILNKPFDYRGSLGYIKEYLNAAAAEGS